MAGMLIGMAAIFLGLITIDGRLLSRFHHRDAIASESKPQANGDYPI